jgi:hypothetical protein
MCVRPAGESALSQFGTVVEALAAAERIPCHPTRCTGQHVIAGRDDRGRIRSKFVTNQGEL